MSEKKGSTLDDLDPMAALLANSPAEPTILDIHFQQTKQNDDSITQKYIMNRKKSHTPDTNIGLGYRQSSSSSFHGTVVTKTDDSKPKEQVEQEADPVLVFDGHSSDTDNEPIELGVRQPSFVRLHGQIIPKGADSLADLHPVIEECPEPPEPIQENEEEDEEEDDDPTVKIVKHFRAKNASRWAAMGYVPPQNLITLVRAKSHAVFNGQALTRNGYTTTSLTKFYMNTDVDNTSPLAGAPIIEEEPNPNNSGSLIPTPSRRKRSGSFGMKLGEASASMDQMHLIIPEESSNRPVETPHIVENPDVPTIIKEEDETSTNLQEVDEAEEDVNEGMEEEEIVAEEEQEMELLGNLSQIVTEAEDSPVYQTILTGELPPSKYVGVVRTALRKYIKLCDKNNWTEEQEYLQNLLEDLPASPSKKSAASPSKAKGNSTPQKNTQRTKCKSAGKHKDLPILETPANLHANYTPKSGLDGSPSASSASSEFRNSTTAAKTSSPSSSTSFDMHLDRLLNKLNEEYKEAAIELDKKWQSQEIVQKYSRPSADLLELRSQARKLLRQHRDAEFERVQRKIKILEEKESLSSEKQLQADYIAADKKLKEHFAIKREVLIKKFEHKKKMLTQMANERSGPLEVKPPKVLNRKNDIQILQKMTDEVLNGRTVQELNIDRIYSKTNKQ